MYITTYNARIEVTIPHLVRCVHCNSEYVYEAKYTGEAREQARPEYAEEKAQEDLAKQLNDLELFTAVPCAECFRYQPHMYARVGYRRYDGLGCVCFPLIGLGMLASIASVVAYFVGGQSSPLLLGVTTGGGCVWLVGWLLHRWRERLASRYDPNEESFDERKRLARELAIRPLDYEVRQSARVRQQYKGHLEKPALSSRGKPKKFVAEWHLSPSVFINGGTLSLALVEGEPVTIQVPENTEPGQALETQLPNGKSFKVRLFAMRVHPSEYELDKGEPE